MARNVEDYLVALTNLFNEFDTEGHTVYDSAHMFVRKLDTTIIPDPLAADIVLLHEKLNAMKMHIGDLLGSLQNSLPKYPNTYIPTPTYPNTYLNVNSVNGGSRKRKTNRKSHNKKHRTHKR